jgi:hypothetical protein
VRSISAKRARRRKATRPNTLVGGVDRQRVREGPYADASLGEVVHEVENLTQVAPDPVESVHHDHVARPGVGEHLGQAGSLDGRAGLVVGVGLLDRDAS